MLEKHGRSHFFKYMTLDTARIVLKNKTLRWCSPLGFNDPFDHQVSFVFPFTIEEFGDELFSAMERLIFQVEPPQFVEPSYLSGWILKFRELVDKVPRKEFIVGLRKCAHEVALKMPEYKVIINAQIKNALNSRVLCMAEEKDNVVMWSHYADSHKGVCLRLDLNKVQDRALHAAKKVEYVTEFPAFLTAQEYVMDMTGECTNTRVDRIQKIPFVKHVHWSYENEWRCRWPIDSNSAYLSEPLNDDSPEPAELFGAVYLGCRMEAKQVQEFVEFAKRNLPNIEIYQAKKSADEFKMEFDWLA